MTYKVPKTYVLTVYQKKIKKNKKSLKVKTYKKKYFIRPKVKSFKSKV